MVRLAGTDLTPRERERYARHLMVPGIGVSGQQALRAARVLVVGAGGLGSPVLAYLAAAGIGTLGIVDDDVVELTNLQRQVLHGEPDLGTPKVDSAAARIAQLNPDVRVVRHRRRLTSRTAPELVDGYDVVVDGSDNFETRYAVSDACARVRVPVVWASVLRFDGQVSVWWAGRGPCYRCVFPRPPRPGDVPSCAEAGVLGAVPGVLGAVQATEVVKLVTGVGRPLVGRLLVHDALAGTWAEIPVRANPTCPACGSGAQEEASSGVPGLGYDERDQGGPQVSGAVPEIAVSELVDAPAGGAVLLVDVRTAAERDIVTIPGSVHVPLDELTERAGELAGHDVVLYCRSGQRSALAVRLLAGVGTPARSLTGGILAWIERVDPTLPRY